MMNSQASAATSFALLAPANAANTAAATSGSGLWLDVRQYTGEILVTQNVGVTTGTITGKLQSATDNAGTGAADITGYAVTASTAASIKSIVVDPRKVPGGFLGYVGTIVTGPIQVSVVASGKKQVV
jgi:hypothetical protein